MSTLVRKRIRCSLKPSRCPETKFTSKITGASPQAAKAGGVEWEFAIFDDDDSLFDITNIASLTVQVTDSVGTVKATKTITRASGKLNSGLTLEQWNAGSAQHALVIFSGDEMNFDAGVYQVQVYGFTDDDVTDTDPLGIADLTLVQMFLNAGAAPVTPGKTPVYAEDLAGVLAGFLKLDNADGVTFKLRKSGHVCEFTVSPDDGSPQYNFV